MPSELAFGLRSTAATYASSASTSLSAYADLPGHHLRSTLDLIATPPVCRTLRIPPQVRTNGPTLTSPVLAT
jgi:hypothetical protein